MFRIVQAGSGQPMSYPVDPSCEFQAGCVGELVVIGNQIMVTVSNGTAPLGIIDDVRTRAFTATAWNETVVAQAVGVMGPNNRLVTPVDIKVELENPNIIADSFVSTIDVSLNKKNGVITFIAGTELNHDALGTGEPNAIKAVVNYTYQVPNVPGDDSTLGSGKVTIWYERMFIQTDQYETNQPYAVKQNLYVSEKGLFTTRQPTPDHPSIGMVTAPPSPNNNMLELIWW